MTAAGGTLELRWRAAGAVMTPTRVEQLRDVLGRAASLLDRPLEPAPGTPLRAPAALSALRAAWDHLAHAASDRHLPGPSLAAAVRLLDDIRTAEEAVRTDQAEHDALRDRAVRCALAGLHNVDTVAGLIARVPEAATSIGFDRVLFSWVENSLWVPQAIHARRDAGWAEEILQAGRQDLRVLDKHLLETGIVRRNRPLSVVETLDRPNLHQAMVGASRTRSYVAAPLTAGSRVVGFLHADCYTERRRVDDTDRELLWMFSEGVSQYAARVTALESLQSIQRQLGVLANADPIDTECWTPGTPPGRRGGPLLPARVTPDEHPGGVLSRREVEVMRLMALGLTNAQIGRKLVIAEGTAKSHVKQILRKLAAANRAEAVSRWLHEQHHRQRPGPGSAAAPWGRTVRTPVQTEVRCGGGER